MQNFVPGNLQSPRQEIRVRLKVVELLPHDRRRFLQHFLGIDVMQLAPRVSDAAAISAKYEVPTMQASDCVVCHKLIDPVAGLFQDYYVVDGKGVFGRRKEGWFADMFGPGFEGEELPAEVALAKSAG